MSLRLAAESICCQEPYRDICYWKLLPGQQGSSPCDGHPAGYDANWHSSESAKIDVSLRNDAGAVTVARFDTGRDLSTRKF
jgi:hypothetical protein